MSDNFEKSAALADHEKAEVEKHKVKISKIVQLVEDILVENDCTWMDWHSVVGIFNERNERVIPKLKIKEIKERFNGQL